MKLSLLTVSPSNVANKYPGIFGLIRFLWLRTHNPLNSKKYCRGTALPYGCAGLPGNHYG